MNVRRLIAAISVFVTAAFSQLAAPGDDLPKVDSAGQNKSEGKIDFQEQVVPLLQKYCTDCHGGAKKKAGLALDIYKDKAATAALEDREIWEKVLDRLQSHEMPPEKRPQPSASEHELVTKWIEHGLGRADCTGQKYPGRVTLRRLNRAEYNNTIHDLLSVNFRPADDFPSDDVGYGFDNIGDVLSLPPVLMEKYMAAAEKIVELAIVADDPSQPKTARFDAADMKGPESSQPIKDSARILASNGELQCQFDSAIPGDYSIQVRAYGQQAGPEPARMAIRLDGQELKTVDVKAVESKSEMYSTPVTVKAGSNRIAVAFVNDYYKPDDPDPKQRDRNLVVEYVEIVGPLGLKPGPLPESHQRIITSLPGEKSRDECAREILSKLASRAYRRPATPEEVNRLARFVDLAGANGDTFERGIQLALQAILVSPHFLFRVEPDRPTKDDSTAPRRLNDFELASRLSYFLWSSMPDDELFGLANAGRLNQEDNLNAQVRRMLEDPRSVALVENFADQWLQIRNLRTVAPDTAQFPTFDDSLRAAMQRETELFFGAIMREDRSIMELLDSDFTFLNERLADHYGIPGVKGDEFRRVSLRGTPRGGVLTQASVLTITSNPTRTSPVKRGKWVLEQLLGTPPPPPPANVPELSEAKDVVLTGTLRQRMEQHRSDPNCAVCHSRMDPLGFGLENFDAIGAWRAQEGKFAIDASGILPTGQSFRGPSELKAVLKTKEDAFRRCLTQKMLTYALGRGTESYDKCAIDEIRAGVAKSDNRISSLVIGIVHSDPFQMRAVQGAKQ